MPVLNNTLTVVSVGAESQANMLAALADHSATVRVRTEQGIVVREVVGEVTDTEVWVGRDIATRQREVCGIIVIQTGDDWGSQRTIDLSTVVKLTVLDPEA